MISLCLNKKTENLSLHTVQSCLVKAYKFVRRSIDQMYIYIEAS
jgi:hypothetical protein